MSKICFVTSSLVGPTLNGGVGTAMYYQACLLEKQGHEVSILFAGNYQVGNRQIWAKKFQTMNISFYGLDEEINDYKINIEDSNWWLWRSYYTMRWLEDKEYDLVHFAETCGYAYHTLQAKRTLNKFSNTQIVVTMHSPTEWIYEGNEIWPYESGEKDRRTKLFLKLNYAERYVCEHADYLLAPSITMFKWAEDKKWKLAENREVLFNPYLGKKETVYSAIDENHLIFFGTLDKRKGIDIFCQAVRKYYRENEGIDLKVSFLGRSVTVENMKSEEYINRNLGDLDIDIEIHTNFDTYKANEYIKNTGGIAVLCSRQDNSPYSIVECIENKVPFICSDVGGMPELVNEKVLFSMNPNSLSRKFLESREIEWKELKHNYSADEANKKICDMNDRILSHKEECIELSKSIQDSKVSVCIAYYNHGRYLETVLKNLEENLYTNVEIIIMDDGSDEESSIEAFDYFKEYYSGKSNMKFIRKIHSSKGGTYNACVEEASGEYILFLNAEQLIMPDAIGIMKKALEDGKLDIVTCHSRKFTGIGEPNITNIEMEVDIPIGACLENGILETNFSKNVFMVKKSVYIAVNGMNESDECSVEHCFIAKCIMGGYIYEVVPMFLSWKRSFGEKNSLSYNKYLNYRAYEEILDTYFENNIYLKHFMKNWCLPRYASLGAENKIIDIKAENDNREKKYKLQQAENAVLEKKNKELIQMVGKVQAELLVANKEKNTLQNDKKYYEDRIQNLQIALNNIENATFWKITKPFRVVIQAIRGLKR